MPFATSLMCSFQLFLEPSKLAWIIEIQLQKPSLIRDNGFQLANIYDTGLTPLRPCTLALGSTNVFYYIPVKLSVISLFT